MSDLINSLTFEDVTLGFEECEILKNCSFDFPLGQNSRIVFKDDRQKFFFFYGLTQVQGFLKGKYLINGVDVTQLTFEEFLPYRLKMGFGFSTRGLIHNRTLKQNLELPLRFHNFLPEVQLQEWLKTCTEYFEMGEDLNKRPAEVSPSSQKATLILRAFLLKPEMIFLDTPELMLSGKLQANLLQLIDDHRKQHNLKHLFFATYDEELSDCLADKNIILDKKKLNQVKVQKITRLAL